MFSLRSFPALILTAVLTLAGGVDLAGQQQPESRLAPTLEDFWEGRAEWVLDIFDVGLPVGESDTLQISESVLWSYLHGSYQSAAIVDQCGQAVAFPGCTVRWESQDGGRSFALPVQVCAMSCQSCPCQDERDHVGQTPAGAVAAAQQYPRVFFDGEQFYMAYEWHAQTMIRTSVDGLVWSDWARLTTPAGTWPSSYLPCSETERIGPHPFIRGEIHDCLVGAPPGIFVEGDSLYVFVAAGSAPGHMRCYKGDKSTPGDLQICDTDPLFSGAAEYGPTDITGADANAHFDFRYVSSADVLKVGDHYYMSYEGIRGPEQLEIGRDTQFGLGFARSVEDRIDGPWEKYTGNPVIEDVGFNWGVGHADLVIVEGVTYLYTTTSIDVEYGEDGAILSAGGTRGRYVLRWLEA